MTSDAPRSRLRAGPTQGVEARTSRDGRVREGDPVLRIESPFHAALQLTIPDAEWARSAEGFAANADVSLFVEDASDFELLARGEPLPTCAVERMWVSEMSSRDPTAHRPVPLDELCLRDLETLPTIPGADLTMALVLTSSPFGDLVVTQHYHDGVRTHWSWGEGEAAQVRVVMPYRRYCEFRAGHLTALEALLHGRIDGEWSDLMMCDGLVEREEAMRAIKAAGCGLRACMALGALGAAVAA